MHYSTKYSSAAPQWRMRFFHHTGVKIGTEFMPKETVYLIDDLAEGSIDPEALLEPSSNPFAQSM
jgi:hypothetical protein